MGSWRYGAHLVPAVGRVGTGFVWALSIHGSGPMRKVPAGRQDNIPLYPSECCPSSALGFRGIPDL